MLIAGRTTGPGSNGCFHTATQSREPLNWDGRRRLTTPRLRLFAHRHVTRRFTGTLLWSRAKRSVVCAFSEGNAANARRENTENRYVRERRNRSYICCLRYVSIHERE